MSIETIIHGTLITLVIIIEIYYWFFWFPKNWKKHKEASDLVLGIEKLYGKDGIISNKYRSK